MINDNAFPNAGSITGSGGPQITGSGIFLYLDYGSVLPYPFVSAYLYLGGTGIVPQSVFNNASITGSGGAQITGSGIFLYLDYGDLGVNNLFVTEELTSGVSPTPPVVVFRPYAYFFKKK